MKLLWRPAAEVDRGNIFDYIYTANRQAAVDLDDAFDYHTGRLIDFPESGDPGEFTTQESSLFQGLLTSWSIVYR